MAFQDDRFRHVLHDKRFSTYRSKLATLDKRFMTIFTDPRFNPSRVAHYAKKYKNQQPIKTEQDREQWDIELLLEKARGRGPEDEDSESDTESLESLDLGEFDKDAEALVGESTHRLALCNCDWNFFTAKIIMGLFKDFLIPGYFIESVSIYLSEFGKAQTSKSTIVTSWELLNKQDERNSYKNIKAARDQFKYYYAVIVCNSSKAADLIYTHCNGVDICTFSTVDLRYIPDDVTFDETPTEVCTKIYSLKGIELAIQNVGSGILNSRLKKEWSETVKEKTRLYNTCNDMDLNDIDKGDIFETYFASSESEEDDNVVKKQKIESLRDILNQPLPKQVRKRMKVDEFNPTNQQLIKNKQQTIEEFTANNPGSKGMKMKWVDRMKLQIKEHRQRKRIRDTHVDKTEFPFDNRFSAVYLDSKYFIDPSHPKFRKSVEMNTMLAHVQDKKFEIKYKPSRSTCKPGEWVL